MVLLITLLSFICQCVRDALSHGPASWTPKLCLRDAEQRGQQHRAPRVAQSLSLPVGLTCLIDHMATPDAVCECV